MKKPDPLEPTHLIPDDRSTEQIKEAAQKAVDAVPGAAEDEAKKALMRERVYTFRLDYKSHDGRVWQGAFTNKIPDVKTRSAIGVMRAQLGGGMPVSSLDEMTQEINAMVAHLTFSLTSAPEWAKDLRALDNTDVLYYLYAEVMAHEATFLGRV